MSSVIREIHGGQCVWLRNNRVSTAGSNTARWAAAAPVFRPVSSLCVGVELVRGGKVCVNVCESCEVFLNWQRRGRGEAQELKIVGEESGGVVGCSEALRGCDNE